MKREIYLVAVTALLGMSALHAGEAADKSESLGPQQHGMHFVDENKDGYNDNAPDHDNDGIPNGVDPDYERGQGKGRKAKRAMQDSGHNEDSCGGCPHARRCGLSKSKRK